MDDRLRFEYPRRLARFALAALSLVLLLVILRVSRAVGSGAVGGGLALGYVLGRGSWSRLRRRILANNILITYFEDSAWAAVLIVLYLATFAPRALDLTSGWLSEHAAIARAVVLVVAAWCTGHAWALYRGVRRHERSYGPLRVKRFHARSGTGVEGMIGRSASVVVRCQPRGVVALGPELWSARSLTDVTLDVGTAVVVRDVEGLRLVVESSGVDVRV